jgi:GH35 family endo-1,4-beta-xylanase
MRIWICACVALLFACHAHAAAPTTEPWRLAAEKRIDEIRKTDLTITVVNGAGKPIPQADILVRQTRSTFGFGTAVNAGLIARGGDPMRTYDQILTGLFNKVVTENDLKWPVWEDHPPDFNHADTLAGLAWLKNHNLAIRGHNLIWPSWQWTPHNLRWLAGDKAAMEKRIEDHIRDICSATNQYTAEWDVVNEPFTNRDVINILGMDAMVQWYKVAHEAAPQAKLYINDFDILENVYNSAQHQQSYFDTIKYLIDHGAPLDGIGMQCHFNGAHLTPPDQLLQILDRFAVFKKDLQVTEFDIETNDEQLQADYTRDFFTTVFSHPAVKGIVMWGFYEALHWRPSAAMFRKDWTIKPNGRVYEDLVLNQWRTDVTGKTDPNGQFKTRGFLGDYDIHAGVSEKAVVGHISLSPQNHELRIVIP